MGGPKRQWAGLLRAYEKGALQLGEAAVEMVDLVDYQAPYHQAEMARARQDIAAADRRGAETERQIGEHATALERACTEHGIQGDRPREELIQAVTTRIEPALQAAARAVREGAVGDAIKLYEQWVAWAHSSAEGEGEGDAEAKDGVAPPGPLLPSLKAMREAEDPPEGGACKVNLVPEFVRAPKSAQMDAASASAADGCIDAPAEIDWGIETTAAEGGGDAGGAPAIDWDVDVSEAAGPEAGGDESSPADGATGEGGVEGGVQPAIDWDITVDDVGANEEQTDAPEIKWDIDVTAASAGGADVADRSGEDAAAMMAEMMAGLDVEGESADTELMPPVWEVLLGKEGRTAVLNDLLELRAFLRVRHAEMSASSASSLMASGMHSMPDMVRDVTADGVDMLEKAVDAATVALTDGAMRELLLLHSSERALGRVAEAIERRRAHGGRLRATLEDVRVRRQQAQSSLAAHHAKLCVIAARAAAVRDRTAAQLCDMFAPRRINLIGQIATVAAYGQA